MTTGNIEPSSEKTAAEPPSPRKSPAAGESSIEYVARTQNQVPLWVLGVVVAVLAGAIYAFVHCARPG